jgi:hypothetical protein
VPRAKCVAAVKTMRPEDGSRYVDSPATKAASWAAMIAA